MKRTNLKEDFLQSMPDVARCQQGLDRNVATKEGCLSEGLFASTRQPCASSSTLANTMVPTLALSLQSCSGSSISNSNSSGLNKISPKTKIQMITTPGLAVGQSEFRRGSMVFRERQLHTSSSSSADKVMRMLGLAQNNCFGGSISNLNGSGSEMISPQAKIQMMPTPGVTIGQSEPLWGSRVFGKGKLHPSSSYSAKKMMGMQGLSQKNCCGDSISTLKGSGNFLPLVIDLTMIVPKSTIQMMPTPTLAAGQSEHRRGSQVMETTAVIQLRELHQRHTLVPENRHITEANSRFNLHQNSLGYSDRRGPIMISKGFYQYTGATIVSQGLMMRQKQPNVPGKCCSHNHVLLQASPIRPFKRKAVEDLEDIQPLSKCMKPIASISSWGMTHVKGHQHLFLVPSFDSKEIDETKKIEFGLHFGLEKDQIFRNDVMDNDTAEIEREEGIRLCFEDIQPLFKCMKPDASLSSLGNTHAKEHQHSDLVSSFGLKEIDEMKKIESNISFGLEKDQIVGNDVMDNETVEIEREDYINLCFEDIQHFSEFMEPDGSISSMEKSHAKGHQHVDLSPSLDLEEINRVECINQTTGSTEIDKQTMMEEKLYTKDASAYKPRKSKIIGASLIEQFTSEQLIDHISSLKRWDGQNKAHVEKNRAIQGCANDDPCQLCMIERRTFYSPSIYCSKCSVRIKKKTFYYTISSNDLSHFICTCCHQRTRGDSVEVDGTFYLKSMLKKKRDNEETHELWVQCDKCDASQHQICALFNKRRNNEVYTCPKCLIKEMENGERPPQPPEVVLGAKDLPKTLMSNHIERRLFTRLKAEREERARIAGKNFDEVPGAEGLVVRVVSSVDKRAEVKRQFLKVFQQENYPSEFPYKSKVLLLFQKIEGVDVCLFVMFVQEYGTKSPLPNRQCVYLSYLDSIKYFQPEVKTTTGEALRTFVYHEILIGYLEYCKKRGFASCNIWASPPRKGEDYILYCHPEIQKTPKYDMLQEWYISMLRKAANEKIVVELTNLYDQFFTSIRECTAKVTPMHLPYFDGDYWPGAAEDMINQFQIEDSRKGKWKKLPGKKSVRTNCLKNPSSNFFKDVLLMKRLGEAIFPVKEDFIMVHLQHVCSHCSVSMVSGACWVCAQCDKFQLCDKCHDFELLREEREKHPSDSREKHLLSQVHMDYLPVEMEDEDEIFESKIFDTRTSFLNFCKANRYQYDTLRRAKYSSMMLLDYLHHPTSATSEETCDDDPGIKEVT